MTKPLRSFSNGREALVGSSFMSLQSACIEAKPATASGSQQASAPPHNMTSARSVTMCMKASPMPCAPEVHADAGAQFAPRRL